MKKLPLFFGLVLCGSASLFFNSCDGDDITKLSGSDLPSVDRGIEDGVDSLPFRLNDGDYFEFEESGRAFELGTFEVTSSGQLRQRPIATDPEIELDERTFLYRYFPQENTSRPANGTIVIAPQHTFTREGDFIPRTEELVQSGSGPGSLSQALTGGDIQLRNQRIIEGVSSLGIIAVEHPDFGLVVRRNISINFSNPTVTVEDDGSGTITGTYVVQEIWQEIVPGSDSLNLLFDPMTGQDILEEETTNGNFTYYFESINQTFGLVE